MTGDDFERGPASIPVSVITGFLGSGKTTLLSRLLADPRMNKAAVIINEFGEVGLDHVLVTSPREDVVLLSSGCLCCSLRGDLVNTALERTRARRNPQVRSRAGRDDRSCRPGARAVDGDGRRKPVACFPRRASDHNR